MTAAREDLDAIVAVFAYHEPLFRQQRQIVAATFKLRRDRARMERRQVEQDVATLAPLQGRLRDQVENLNRRMMNRGVLGEGSVHQELQFTLRDWLRYEDLFDYGMQPQFLSRFDNSIILEDLHPDLLRKIFLDHGRIVGFRLAGDIRGAGTYRALMLKGTDVSQFGEDLLDPRFRISRCVSPEVLYH